MAAVTIYTDGGSRNNPGEAGAGFLIYEGDTCIAKGARYLGVQTNNWAEYEAVWDALQRARELNLTERVIEVRLDSKLVVEQLSGNWKIKEPTLRPQHGKIRALIDEGFTSVTFTHIPRHENGEADALANEAMDRGV